MLIDFKKVSVAIVVCFLLTLNIQSQELINFVPNDCMVSGLIDLKQIDAKSNLIQIVKMPLMEKLNAKMMDFILGPSTRLDSSNILDLKAHGIATNTKAWFYVKKSKELYYGAIIFVLDNESAFSAYIQKSVNPDEGIKVMNAGDYKYYNNHKLNVSWNSKLVAFYGAAILPAVRDSIQHSLEPISESDYYNDFRVDTAVVEDVEVPTEEVAPTEDQLDISDELESNEETANADSLNLYIEDEYALADTTAIPNNYSDDSYFLSIKKTSERCDSLIDFWCSTNASIFLTSHGSSSVSENKIFMDYIKDNPDGALMVDYGTIAELEKGDKSLGMYGLSSWTSYYSDFIKEYYKNLYLLAKVKLNKDDIQFSYDMTHSVKMKSLFKEVKKTKISSKFLKYISNDVMAYGAVGIDIPGYLKGMGNVMREIYPTIPSYGEIFGASMDILDIIIDQEALYKIFTGDMLIALNGIKPVQVTHTAYDYDDNYNMTERIDTTTQMQPEILFMAGIGNIDDVKKILKLSVVSKVFSLENDLYSLTYKGADLPVFMKINDGILFISNNKSFVENPLALAKDKQLSKEHFKMFRKNTGVLFANSEKIVQSAASEGLAKDNTILSKSSNVFKNVKVTTGQKNDKSYGNFIIQLSKTDDNSLTDIFKFLNELFLSKTTRFD